MATSNNNASNDLVFDGEHVKLSKARHGVALESTWEIAKLICVLRDSVPLTDDEHFYTVRGLSVRIEELTNIIMGAIDGEAEKIEELAYRLRLKRTQPSN